MKLKLKEEGGGDMGDRSLYECSKCGKWESAMFTVYGDKKVNFCPFCGSNQYLRQIKSGKREDENKKK